MLRRLKLSESGFTGIEVLIVLTIVIIVALLVANNVQESVARGRDIERRSDINAIQDALEEYWHSQEHYPTDLAALGGINSDILTDPNGNLILISAPAESDNKPSSSYTSAEQPEQEYTYAPYQCGGETETSDAAEDNELVGQEIEGLGEIESVSVEGVQVCQKYVLYSWLEKAELGDVPYQRNNLHNL
ncbi:type II secretion system protein [Candidatus Saccharibacteria bacterium]|nr:type II secretion system protein [Candidatus Saccharibacteria bacterium]